MPNKLFDHMKVLPLTIEKAESTTENGRKMLTIKGMASTEDKDLENEIIHVGAFDRFLDDFRKNPQMYWMHGWGDACGRWDVIEPIQDKGYQVEGRLIHLGGSEDERRFAMVEEGLVNSMSVGFSGYYSPEFGYMDEQTRTWHWTQNCRLMEVSLVTIPCNPGATMELAKALGFEMKNALDELAKPTEEARVIADLDRLSKATESLRNITRHWDKEGGAPSANLVTSVLSPISMIVEIVEKAGRVLSAQNREAVEKARDALSEVLERDAASSTTEETGDKSGADEMPRLILPEIPKVVF